MSYDYRAEDEDAVVAPFQLDRYEQEGVEAPPLDDEGRPRILLMGLQTSGKSSIARVVFHRMSPNECQFLESTHHIDLHSVPNTSFLNLQVWDCPGQQNFTSSPVYDAQALFGHDGALVFVLDAQDDVGAATATLCQAVQDAYSINENLNFEVLIHKVDLLGTEEKRVITQQINDAVHDGLYGVDVQISFYLTSIFDVSIFEAMSKIAQKLVPQFPGMQNMLDTLAGRCNMTKVFLFDVSTKIYVATDSRSVDISLYEACSDSIDLAIDVSGVFSEGSGRVGQGAIAFDESTEATLPVKDWVLYLRHVSQHLVVVCVMSEALFAAKTAVIKANVDAFRKGMQGLLQTHSPSQ